VGEYNRSFIQTLGKLNYNKYAHSLAHTHAHMTHTHFSKTR
jgi:hypothetical protein